jgi:hypothetical protein
MGEDLQSAPGSRVRNAEVRLLDLAERQEGLLARGQLGRRLSGGEISRWLEQGRIHRVHPGVYALGHRGLTPRGELIAALLYAGPGAALAGASSAHWWQVVKAPPRTIEVATPHRRRSVPGLAVRHRPNLERVEHRGLPVTPLAQTLRDLATVASAASLRKALAEADYRGLLDPTEIQAACGPGRPGSAALRRALLHHLPLLALTRNELEETFLGLCESAGLPHPEINAQLGPYEVDALWPEHRLIVELDGGAAHGRAAAVVRDRSRELYLRERGFRVVRYSWLQVFEEPGRVAADLARELTPRPAGRSRSPSGGGSAR